ncbi:glycine-rich domain-containing protein [Escherichia coli]|uniref:glycine-rich domain-containing protein n=1 Tax=Escherichia coli TaxID=562 RepID=UPI003FCD220D
MTASVTASAVSVSMAWRILCRTTLSVMPAQCLGTRKIKVILTGGGGGGSSVIATSFSQTAFGGGGGSAATCIGIFDLEDISDFSVVIGAGGTADNPGGTSTFNGMSAGRGGSGSGVNTPSIGSGGADGTATGGLINIHGGYGSDGQQGSYYSFGNGAASFWGGGGRAGSANGVAAKAYGAGGGAAYDTAFSGVLKAGGTGAPGICVIEEFA